MTKPPASDASANLPRLQLETDGPVTCVTFPRNDVDGVAVRELFEAAATLTDDDTVCMLVDLQGVAYVSSGLMGILVAIRKKFMHVGGQLHIVVPEPRLHQQFVILNLHRVLKLFAGLDEAKQAFKV